MGGKYRGIESRGESIRLHFTYQGIRCRETLKLPPTKANLQYAVNLRGAILRDIARNTFDYANYFPESARAALSGRGRVLTVKDALGEFITSARKGCAHSTYRDYLSAVNYYLVPHFGDKTLAEVTAADIRAWITTLNISNKRINNILIPLRQVFLEAFEDQVIDRNPMARVRNLKVVHDDPDPFEPDQVRAILEASAGQERALFLFAFWTGLRVGELIALEWQDIDFKHGRVHVRRSRTRGHLKAPKTSSSVRLVDLLPPASEALQAQRAHTRLAAGAVFHNPYRGRAWDTDLQVRNAFKRACARAGIAYKSIKQTRHTYASALLSAGEDPAWVARQLGHTNPAFTMRVYARWIPAWRPDAGNKVRAMLGQIWAKTEGNGGE